MDLLGIEPGRIQANEFVKCINKICYVEKIVLKEKLGQALYYRCLNYQPSNLSRLFEYFDVVELEDPSEDADQILEEANVVCAPLGYRFDKTKIQAARNLSVILSNTTGVAHIDVTAAVEAGVAVCALHNEPAFLESITPTAEHTLGLLLAAWRRLPAAYCSAIDGHWDRRPFGAPRMLSRMQIGLVGYGRLGRKVDSICRALGMTVRYFDPYVPGGEPSVLDLARKSDILSIHAIANKETHGLVSRKVLESLPPGAVVVNTARGELLDEDALIDLMESGHIYAAGLDVLRDEFNPDFKDAYQGSRTRAFAKKCDRLVLTPHIGGSTIDAWTETERFVIDKSIRLMKSKLHHTLLK